jgi:N-acylglucosamine 2-epimerase
MDQHRRQQLIDTYRSTLLDNVLPFWLRNAIDRECGGFITSLDRDGTVIDTDKSVWQQGRFTWLLAELYNCPLLANHPDRSQWLQLAEHGADFLRRFCFDASDGRMWFHVTREGLPIRKRRYAFSESFAAMAFGELAKALNSQEYADLAATAFQRFVDHNLHPPAELAKFTNVRPTRSIGFPMIAINTAQELRESIGLASANSYIDRSIDSIARYHLKHDLAAVMEVVGPEGEIINHFDGRTLNPGHAIEGAWFVMFEGQHRNDDSLVEMGRAMLDWMWQRGWDQQHGGILYFTDVYGLPVQEYWHDMKFWWPHNEAVIATLTAHQLTGDAKYAEWHTHVHDWSFDHFADPEHGEWYGYLHRDGRISVPLKGNLWKGPFHLPRMLLVCWRLLESPPAVRPPGER